MIPYAEINDEEFVKGVKSLFENIQNYLITDDEGNIFQKLEVTQMFKTKTMFVD
jgi:hypothetical protein